MIRRPFLALGVVVLAGIVLLDGFFLVGQNDQALVTALGRPVRVINAPGSYEPGLKAKIPFLETAYVLDRRIQTIEAEPADIVSADRKPLRITAFLRYRVVQPVALYTALRGDRDLHIALQPAIAAALRGSLAQAKASDIVSGEDTAQLNAALAAARAKVTEASLGIEIVYLGVKRVGLAPAGAETVYQRMRSDLEQQAAQIRADGETRKREIMGDADREATAAIAKAGQNALAIRGEGDARSAALFAASFGKDLSFAAFYRSMEAYEVSLANSDTTLVLSADSDFLKYFKHGPRGK